MSRTARSATFPLLRCGSVGKDPDTGEEMLLFYGGPFSQWTGPAMAIDGVDYDGPEQYMMAQKARVFGDSRALKVIMASKSPAQQKAAGRAVRGFDRERWDLISRDVVRTASLHKFRNPVFRRDLKMTADMTIVEASPTDVVWGIGLGESDPDALRRSAWRGTNWLGQVLMEVRALIRG